MTEDEGGFERYIAQSRIDFVADRVSYRQVTLYLDDEFRKFGDELAAVASATSGTATANRQ